MLNNQKTPTQSEFFDWRYVLVKIRTYFQENPDADF